MFFYFLFSPRIAFPIWLSHKAFYHRWHLSAHWRRKIRAGFAYGTIGEPSVGSMERQ